MIILKDSDLAGKLRLLKAFGVDRTHGERKILGSTILLISDLITG